ncbi:MAG: biopolymer transporter ExbD [Acidobacteria bacterium]|nr:biopolymer transporter ExbD [Acidobacteriota bacterium]
MAMAAGRAGPSAEMNVTPMIDILLVLIIIFMMIQSHNRGEEALIPRPPAGNAAEPVQRTVVLELRAGAGPNPSLRLNQQPVSWPELQNRLTEIYKSRSERVLFIQADQALDFAPVADAIDIAHSAYPDIKVGLITAAPGSGA